MRVTGRKLVVAAILVGALASVARITLWQPLVVTGTAEPDGYVRASGVVHVHTIHSDGGGSLEEVAAAAASAGLDYVIVTDHNTFDAKSFEGYVDGVLMVVGAEVSTDSGHVLGVGLPAPTFRFSGDARDTLEDVADLGGATFVAHPTSPREGFGWGEWQLPGSWGIEVLNGDTQWRSAGWATAARTMLLYPLNPTYALLTMLGRPSALDRWDRLLVARDVPGIAGSDSHNYIGLAGAAGLRFPSYEAVFRVVRNHVLLEQGLRGDSLQDTEAVVAALAGGRAFVGLDGLAPATGFSFVAEDEDQRWTMGETVVPTESLQLRAGGRLPHGASVSLIKDGTVIAKEEGGVVWQDVGAGVYRVEVELPGWDLPWVVSNPIYVFEPQVLRQREARREPPAAVVPASVVRSLDGFDDETTFRAVSDPSTTVQEEMLGEEEDVAGNGIARMEFMLGVPSTQHPAPYAALESYEPRDLSRGQGLVVSVKADGIYRLWLQVRDRNPDSEDNTEWWVTSLKTSTQWQRVAVPFNRFRTLESSTDGQLDLNEVEGVLFIVNADSVMPGTTGTIWFDDLDMY